MKNKRLLATVLALTLVSSSALALTGCGDEKSKETGKGGETSDPAKDKKDAVQELSIPQAVPKSMDPAKAKTDSEWAPGGLVYEGLARNEKQEDGTEKVEPAVAESWEKSQDGLTYTIKLRNNAKWHDGQQVKAQDFVYSWGRVVDPKTGSGYGNMLNGIVLNATSVNKGEKKVEELGIKAKDDTTLEIKLEKPCGFFEQLLFFPVLKPVRKDIVEKYGEQYGTSVDKIMGNGAYKMTKYEDKNQAIFEKADTYWDKDNRFITKVTYLETKDNNAKYSMLESGQVDYAAVQDTDWIEKFKADDRFEYINNIIPDVEVFLLNGKKNEYLSNAKIRKALSASIDRQAYIDQVSAGLGKPAYNFVPPAISIDGKPFNPEGKNEYAKELLEENKDPKALLKEGLKELGKPEDPSKVTITMLTRGVKQKEKEGAEYFQQVWKEKLGINLKIEMLEYNIMNDRVDKGDFEIACSGWFADWNDPSNFLEQLHSGYGYYKSCGWKNAEYDKLIDDAKVEPDQNKRLEMYKKAEKILIKDDAAMIPYQLQQRSTFQRKYVKGRKINIFGFGDYKGVYISGKEK